MRSFIYARKGQPHQYRVMAALSQGLAKHGIECMVRDNYTGAEQADFLVWWGDKVPEHLMKKPRLILEAGYINGQSGDYHQDRLRYVSAGWNGLHGRADPGALGCPPDRFDAIGVSLRPWRTDGEYILVCEQHPGDAVAPQDRDWWAPMAAMALRHDIPVKVRPHPLCAPDMKPLSESLENAKLCLTWSSTCGIQSVIAGVPTIALDLGSMARDVSEHHMTLAPVCPDRQQWANDLAYRQWTHRELESGDAWEIMDYGRAQAA